MNLLAIICIFLVSDNVFAQKISAIPDLITAGMVANGCCFQGKLLETGLPFDIAISGDGWLPLKSGADILYTRYGKLTMNDDGYLIHKPSGLMVLADVKGELQTVYLPDYIKTSPTDRPDANLLNINFDDKGTFRAFYSDGTSEVGFTIALAAVKNEGSKKTISKEKYLVRFNSQVSYFTFYQARFAKIYYRHLEEQTENRY
jgi:flagellar hook protein FlgE